MLNGDASLEAFRSYFMTIMSLMYFVQEPLRRRKFDIVGIYDLGVEEVDKAYVIGDLSVIQRNFNSR